MNTSRVLNFALRLIIRGSLVLLITAMFQGCGRSGSDRPTPKDTLALYQQTARQSGYIALLGVMPEGTEAQRLAMRHLLEIADSDKALEDEMDRRFGGRIRYGGLRLENGVSPRDLYDISPDELAYSVEGDVAKGSSRGKPVLVMVWDQDRWLVDWATFGLTRSKAEESGRGMGNHARMVAAHLADVRAGKFASRQEADESLTKRTYELNRR